MSHYPDRHHPVFFLLDALAAIGVKADFAKDDRTLGCWGMIFPDYENRVLVWLIDNRLPHEAAKEDPAAKALLAMGALVCHAQKSDMERVGGLWLPLATSPGFHPVGTMITSDVAFVGYVRDEGRARLLADVGKRFKLSVNQGIFGKQATEAYCGAYVGLNIPSHYDQPYCTDINMRVFEIAACAVPLVTNDLPGLVELGFIDGKTCITYGAHRSVADAIQYAIDHREMRIAGRQLIKDRHTYEHRAEQVKQWLSA
jgi:glycosyltransferase involved in cell wall biosynthesis